jgi:putative hydrolase of the HAD superfamily
MYKHLFFDLDHTLWDFEKNATEAISDLYSQLQLNHKGFNNFDLFLQHYLKHNTLLWDQYHLGTISTEDLKWKRMYQTILEFNVNNINLAKQMSETFLDILPEKKYVFPYTFEILDYLKAKEYILHLITNGFTVTQHRKLKASGLGVYFEHVITSENAGAVKPNKSIFETALTMANATVAESLMLGDNIVADIQGAYNAGWHSVFVNHVNAEKPAEATYMITNLKELEAIV